MVTHLHRRMYRQSSVAGAEERHLRLIDHLIHPLCPVHSARRHLNRIRAHPTFREQSDFPLVPSSDGRVPTKRYMIQFFRRTISATGIPTTRQWGRR
jgi:hypothetical protein